MLSNASVAKSIAVTLGELVQFDLSMAVVHRPLYQSASPSVRTFYPVRLHMLWEYGALT